MPRPGLLPLVVPGLAVAAASARGEGPSKALHVTARLVRQTFSGDPASPQRGDRRRPTVALLAKSGIGVGTGGGAGTGASVPPSTRAKRAS